MKNKTLDLLLETFWKKQTVVVQKSLKNNEAVGVIGIYGVGFGLFVDCLKNYLTSGVVIEVNLKDIKPKSNKDVYRLAVSQLQKEKFIKNNIDIPNTDFEFHYLLKEVLEKNNNLTIIFTESQYLLSLTDGFWDSLESLRYYQQPNLQLVFIGQPGLVNFSTQASRRLLKNNFVYIKTFSKKITKVLLRQKSLSDKLNIENFVWKYSKGHYGTIKYLQQKLYGLLSVKNMLVPVFNRKLFSSFIDSDPLLLVWIKQIFAELSDEQQSIVRCYLNTGKIDEKVTKIVCFKQLVNLGFFSKKNNKVSFLFEEFSNLIKKVSQESKTIKKKIFVNDGKIVINGIDASLVLSKDEQSVITCLLKNKNDCVSYEQLGSAIWGSKVDKKYSLWAINKLISRLRSTLETINISKKTIKTIRGRGYGWYGF